MKRFLFVLLLVMSTTGLHAELKKLYIKETRQSTLALYQDTDVGDYILSAYEIDLDNETYNHSLINCEDEQKIKKFLAYLLGHNLKNLYTPTIVFYESTEDDLELYSSDIKIDDNRVIKRNIYKLK